METFIIIFLFCLGGMFGEIVACRRDRKFQKNPTSLRSEIARRLCHIHYILIGGVWSACTLSSVLCLLLEHHG